MIATSSCVATMTILMVVMDIAGAKGSSSDNGVPFTQKGVSDGRDGPYPTTQDTERSPPLVTTPPPLDVPNHHPLFRGLAPRQSQKAEGLGERPPYFEDGGGRLGPRAATAAWRSRQSTGVVATSPPSGTRGGAALAPRGATLTNGRMSDLEGEDASVDILTAPVTRTSASPPRTTTGVAAGDRQAPTVPAPSVPGLPADMDEETTTTTITTTTITTTTTTAMRSPGLCRFNLTAPDGYIQTPQGAEDCIFTVTVHMGYGVEIQVMNVSLSGGDRVTFEDLGGREPSLLANESILMRGLVVRSRSNQITVRFRGQPQAAAGAAFLLRYQGFVLSCTFPQRPAYGDVSVSSLHSGGGAYFYCLTGYRLQGPSVLTCLNATTPYWSGKEPQCLAACGGVVKNASVGRIVSPGFPSNYSNNLTCHWLLEAPEGQRVHVHFEKVALAEDDDRLLIKNGNGVDSPALYDSYEVEYLPNEGLVSSSRHLFIELTTDSSGTSTGIAIRYQAFAAGHCYEPFVKYGNFSGSEGDSWAVGTVVEFSCEPGYTLEQGAVVIECVDPANPQWNETEPACRAVCSGEMTDSAGVVLSPNWPEAYDQGQDCIWGIHVEEDKRIMLDIQVLNIGKNDLLTFYDGDDLTARVLGQYGGARPRFKLYTSTADVTVQFQSDPATNVYGYDHGFVVRFFEVPRNDTCPELPEITSGWKSTSHPGLVHGTVVTYQCYPGYQLLGTELLVCQWDLTWSGDLPSCERVLSCADPGSVEHGRRVTSGPHLTVGSTIQYICSAGFTLSGNSLLSCYNHGSSGPRWSQRLPRCVPESHEPCKNPGTPTFSVPSSDKRLFQAGETLRFSCLGNHELLGEPVLRCVPGHPSQWSSLPPVCRAEPQEYVSERRLDVSSAERSMEGAGVAIFIPVALSLLLISGIYLYFSKVQGKSLRLPSATSLPYNHIPVESTLDNSVYETANSEESQEYEVSI